MASEARVRLVALYGPDEHGADLMVERIADD
jgi:hypothetical protein